MDPGLDNARTGQRSVSERSASINPPGIPVTAQIHRNQGYSRSRSKSALLNSDQVRAALVLNPANDETKEGNTDGYKKRLGGMSSHQFDAKIVERENELMRREEYGRSRSRPAMESTLPIAWGERKLLESRRERVSVQNQQSGDECRREDRVS